MLQATWGARAVYHMIEMMMMMMVRTGAGGCKKQVLRARSGARMKDKTESAKQSE